MFVTIFMTLKYKNGKSIIYETKIQHIVNYVVNIVTKVFTDVKL